MAGTPRAGAGALAGWLLAFVIDLDDFGASIDVTAFLGVPALLLLIATFASWLLVRRAIRVDPMVAPREE